MKVRANCKINIGLDVLRRREDGFHDLETVMYPVRGLYDEIEIVPSDTLRFVQNGIAVDCPDEDNLCVKAYRLMQSRYGIGGALITLDKHVPFGAGLGGGSSDATAVILALNGLFGLSLSEVELLDAAATLGSDTAFFVRNTPQLCCGRGEILTPIELPLDGKYLVILKPAEGVSTREAYAGVRPHLPEIRLADALSRPVGDWSGAVKNDFEPHVFAAHPIIGRLKAFLLSNGAEYASMSGSGSAVFGIFADEPSFIFDSVFSRHSERSEDSGKRCFAVLNMTNCFIDENIFIHTEKL